MIDIGFGGGRAVDVLLERTAHVTAIDPAADMVAALSERHASAVDAGRLDVHEGGVEQLPLADAAVDAARTVNTVYFWPELPGPLAEINRALAPGGTLVIAIRDGAVMDNVNLEIFTIRSPDQIRTAAEDAGFESWVEVPADHKVHFIVARKPGDGAAPELFEGCEDCPANPVRRGTNICSCVGKMRSKRRLASCGQRVALRTDCCRAGDRRSKASVWTRALSHPRRYGRQLVSIGPVSCRWQVALRRR